VALARAFRASIHVLHEGTRADMVTSESSESGAPPALRRVIKRYSNRKLYDTKDSRYVTLLQIAEMVRAG
jgi:hypothetical protein